MSVHCERSQRNFILINIRKLREGNGDTEGESLEGDLRFKTAGGKILVELIGNCCNLINFEIY